MSTELLLFEPHAARCSSSSGRASTTISTRREPSPRTPSRSIRSSMGALRVCASSKITRTGWSRARPSMTEMNPACTSGTKAVSSRLSARPNRSARRWAVRADVRASDTRSASSTNRCRTSSGLSPARTPATSPTIAAAGENVAVSVRARVWPRRMRTAALTPAASSSASRDLPMPDSPTTVARTGLPLVLATPRLWPRIACSFPRPTKGIVRRAERGVSPSTA